MRPVHTSRLSEVKSVFNSESDNVQYYNVLKNSNSLKLYNVELAKPIIQKNKGEIVWQSESDLELKGLSDLSDSQRIKYGDVLKEFFENFKSRIAKFSNIPQDFVKKVMQIPNKESILINEAQNYIVIVNWGFLEDKFDRKEGIIETLFPIPNQSILVRLINENNEPIENQNIRFTSIESEKSEYTNLKGYARFGSLTRGENFTLNVDHKLTGKKYSVNYTCDGRDEYLIQTRENVKIKVVVKDKFGNPVENQSFQINSAYLGSKNIDTKNLGHFSFHHKINNEYFEVKDDKYNVLLRELVPHEDSTFIINYKDDETIIDDSEEVFEERFDEFDGSFKVIFVNSFKKPIKLLNVTIEQRGQSFIRQTNENGEIVLDIKNGDKFKYSFSRYGELWSDEIYLKNYKGQLTIVAKPIFPWLWWLLILLLLIIFWCCALANCFCSTNTHIVNENKIKDDNQKEQSQIAACDVQTVSGGYGKTKTKHSLGENSGIVELIYNMKSIPDKLEVFYQDKLVVSTYDVKGNINGFVGGDLSTGPNGTLKFKYRKEKSDQVTVVVTGSNENTSWDYLISCPK